MMKHLMNVIKPQMSKKGVDVKSYTVNPFLLLYFTNEVIKTLFIICFGII